MTEKDLAKIESELDVKLPAHFRAFMLAHGKTLKSAAKTLRFERVLETSPAKIIKVNRELRKNGIFIGDDPTPWPSENLALVSDLQDGDIEFVKLDEESGKVDLFLHEEGEFHECFASFDAYLADLAQRLETFRQSPAGKSDKKLIKRSPSFYLQGRSLGISTRDIDPPLNPQRLAQAGVDTARLSTHLTTMLQALTQIPAADWSVLLGAGSHPGAFAMHFTTKLKSPSRIDLCSMQGGDAEIRLSLQTTDPQNKYDPAAIDWPAFHESFRGLHECLLRTPLSMTPVNMTSEEPTCHGYFGFEIAYTIAAADT